VSKQNAVATFVILLTAVCFIPKSANAFELVTTTETVVVDEVEIDIVKTADNFIVLYDTSSSMDEVYKDTGKRKIEIEKAILQIRNAALPPLDFNAGIYSFTPKSLTFSTKTLKPIYPMQPYNKTEFAKAIEQLPTDASGPTLLQQGLSELKDILAELTGRTVVFIVTDGKYTDRESMQKPVDIARGLAEQNDVCFYAINSSPEEQESHMLKAVSSINECSRVITFDQFINNPLMLSGALFVINGRIVERSIDIEKIIGAKLNNLLFAFDSAEINEDYADGLKLLGGYMQDNPDVNLSIAGFTDSTGPQEYNLGLSRRRVESVTNYLVQKLNVESGRIILNWYGESNPEAGNDTVEGRNLNRRVEGFVFGME
jgi:OOP family OmpA-OmpF porin